MVLSWGAQSGKFNDEEAQLDEEGNLLPSAGVAFDKVDPSLSLITEFPTIGDDGRSATFVWSRVLRRLPDRRARSTTGPPAR